MHWGSTLETRCSNLEHGPLGRNSNGMDLGNIHVHILIREDWGENIMEEMFCESVL